MSQQIKHVFVLMLENHSFDNMFALSGIPGIIAATTSDKNYYNGQEYPVESGAPVSMPTDPGHEFPDVVEQLCGQGAKYPDGGPYPKIDNSGYVANYATSTTEGSKLPPAKDFGDVMKCFEPKQLPVLYQLATEFAICDQWFSSLPGPTWPNRYFLHGASSADLVVSPSKGEMLQWEGGTRIGLGFRYPNGSIFDAMNAMKPPVKWRLYNDKQDKFADNPSIVEAWVGSVPQVSSINGIDMKYVNSFSPNRSIPGGQAGFASDLQGSYDYQYTFIEPNYGNILNGSYEGGSSQHPMDDLYGGEGLIKATYEAIRNSPLWDSSLLIIVYDEHGGFYDSCKPGPATAPGDDTSKVKKENYGKENPNPYGFNFKQYGVRVPAVVVSPLIQKGTVDHTVYDHTSVLATLEKLFDIPPLTERDKNANDVLDLVSLTSPRTDCPTTLNNPVKSSVAEKAPLTAEEQAELDKQPIPKSGYLASFMATILKADLDLSQDTEEEKKAIVENFEKIKTRGEARAYAEKVLAKIEGAK